MSRARIVSMTVEVPAGEYWVGDPCYGVPDDRWMDLLQSCDYFRSAIGTVDGAEVVAFGTAHGDGVYRDGQGREYPVDSGTLGLILVGAFPDPLPDLMHRVTFDRPAECGSEGGVITFGNIDIDTGYDAPDDDEDEDWDDRSVVRFDGE